MLTTSFFAWSGCKALKEATFLGKTSVDHFIFDQTTGLHVKVPAEYLDYYKSSLVATEHETEIIEAIEE